MSGVEVDNSLSVAPKHDVSNDVGSINKDEGDVKSVGNGQPEENSSPFVSPVKNKSVADTNGEKLQPDINTANAEEKHDPNSSTNPVKRKQAHDKSDSETEDRGTPAKKPRSETAERSSDADSPTKTSDDDSGVKKSPKKRKRVQQKPNDSDNEEVEELEPGSVEKSVVLKEGQKREKKKVQRLEILPPSVKKEKRLSIEEGSGVKLGDIPNVEFHLQRTHSGDLKPLHRLLFDKVTSPGLVKKNIRQFSGFAFSADSIEKKRKLDKLTKWYTTAMMKSICETLDLERGGKKEDLVDRILSFLMDPKSSGKPLPSSTVKRRSSSKLKKGRASKGGSAKKSKVKKSKGEDKEESGEGKSEDEAEINKSAAGSDEDVDKSTAVESPKPPKKKKKKASTPAKQTPKAQKKTPKSASAKKVKKPAKKSKVSSGGESSGDEDADEPLVKKKVAPTDDMLKSVVKKILKTANLEEVTMKTVCKQVYEKFPDFDLTSRKDFIKATVKQILK